jgi:hypothetical protein
MVGALQPTVTGVNDGDVDEAITETSIKLFRKLSKLFARRESHSQPPKLHHSHSAQD